MTTPEPDAVVLPPLPKLPWHDDASFVQWAERYATAAVLADRGRRAFAALVVAEPSDMLWCETCEGIGVIDERLGGYSTANSAAECPDCDGKGWWRRQNSAELLRKAGVPFEDKNGGAHLVVRPIGSGMTADFWPGTGRWTVRGLNQTVFGVHKLLSWAKARQNAIRPKGQAPAQLGAKTESYPCFTPSTKNE